MDLAETAVLYLVNMGFSSFMKALEVKPTDDEFEAFETTRWGNKVRCCILRAHTVADQR